MNFRLIGAALVVVGCGSCGFLTASQYQTRIKTLRFLIDALNYMSCELQFRCTPLPLLCRQAGERSQGRIKRLFLELASELDSQISPDASRCMTAMLDKHDNTSPEIRALMLKLGAGLGNFNLSGQLKCMDDVRAEASEYLHKMLQNKDVRIRSYQTLGLCAGAAIAILFV